MKPLPRVLARVLALALIVTTCGPLTPQPVAALGLPTLGDSASDALSPLMERKLGEEIMRDIRRDPDYLDDAPVLEYLNAFGSSLVAARPEARGEASFDFFFFAVRDATLNAFALPGGFVAVHSGLVLAAQSESELASVMAHEIGHVVQRHIARMLGQQKQDALIPLAAILLGVLAAKAGNVGDAPAALVMGGQGLAMQRQLNFSRDAEREADRIGLQILQEAHFDTSGMVAFFGRMQKAPGGYTDVVPAYLRSHPLTTERIADIEARIRDQPHTSRPDSLDFHLIQARLRVLQDGSAQGLREAGEWFEKQLQKKVRAQTVAAKYGLALIALKQGGVGDLASAQALLAEARVASLAPQDSIMASLSIDIALASKPTSAMAQQVVKQADAVRVQFPLSRGIARQYAHALIAAGRYQQAVDYLRDQAQMYRTEPQLQQALAEAYAAQGRQALQHIALAESYALNGSLPDALQQLTIARRAPDATFYDQAIIDARERELQARWVEVLKAQGKKP
ncbi:MAG: M48 family metallopeptidase [Glaciimonas sp.]|nr:M48 family metallopeptidase [Glaciimonas sp.]